MNFLNEYPSFMQMLLSKTKNGGKKMKKAKSKYQ